jgi:hypothetical protein
MANCPTVPLAVALERQTVPPVRVDSNRTVPGGLAPETLR